MKSTVTDLLREFQKLIPTRPQYLNFFGHMHSIFDRDASQLLILALIMYKLAKAGFFLPFFFTFFFYLFFFTFFYLFFNFFFVFYLANIPSGLAK